MQCFYLNYIFSPTNITIIRFCVFNFYAFCIHVYSSELYSVCKNSDNVDRDTWNVTFFTWFATNYQRRRGYVLLCEVYLSDLLTPEGLCFSPPPEVEMSERRSRRDMSPQGRKRAGMMVRGGERGAVSYQVRQLTCNQV